MPLAGPPPAGTALPEALERVADGAPSQLVWANEAGGLTVRIEHPDGVRFAKWAPADGPLSLEDERLRLEWLSRNRPAVAFPDPVDHGRDADGEWLVTHALPGENAVSEFAFEHPERAAVAIGEGLRLLHTSLDPADCPFSWDMATRVATAERAGIVVPEALRSSPPPERTVVCHGDPCVPNTLLDTDGTLAGIVDLGTLGAADRWADLAVATWSLKWNFEDASPEDPVDDVTPSPLELVLLEAYGISPDEERTRYYRRLWAAT